MQLLNLLSLCNIENIFIIMEEIKNILDVLTWKDVFFSLCIIVSISISVITIIRNIKNEKILDKMIEKIKRNEEPNCQ